MDSPQATNNTGGFSVAVVSSLSAAFSSKFALFQQNPIFWAVVWSWFFWYTIGTLHALRNSWLRIEDGFSPKKSTDGLFILLGWGSLFYLTGTMRELGGDSGKLTSNFIEVACLATQGAWLFRKGGQLVGAKWIIETADVAEDAAEAVADKAQEIIKSKTKEKQ